MMKSLSGLEAFRSVILNKKGFLPFRMTLFVFLSRYAIKIAENLFYS